MLNCKNSVLGVGGGAAAFQQLCNLALVVHHAQKASIPFVDPSHRCKVIAVDAGLNAIVVTSFVLRVLDMELGLNMYSKKRV